MPLNNAFTEQPTVSQTKRAKLLIEPGEQLIAVVRRHPIGYIAIYLSAAVFLVAILVLFIFVSPDKIFSNLASSTTSTIIDGTLLAAAILTIILVAMVWIYKQSRMIVTDKSLVQVIQRTLFNRQISRLSMSNVQDVKAEKRGIWATIFDYGTLIIQTAGKEENFIFPWCPRPDKYADIILEAREQYVKKFGENDTPTS